MDASIAADANLPLPAGCLPCAFPPGRPSGVSGAASRVLYAGMDGEDLDQTGDGKNPQHLLLRRSQQHIAPGAPGVLPHALQRCQAAGVHKLQACQIDDDVPLAGGDLCERSRDTCGVGYVKLAA
jgi:hypothetical protein